MASFCIYEDQENKSAFEGGKENIPSLLQQKRSVLGVINNKNHIQHKSAKTAFQEHRHKKELNNENSYPKHGKKKVVPSIPVAQFEAFSVYEDTKSNTEKFHLNSKEIVGENVQISGSMLNVHRAPLHEVKNVSLVSEISTNDNAICPMSVDNSLVKYQTEPNERNLRDRFFEIEEYQQDIYQYLRNAEIRNRPKPGYMKKQPDITHTMRTILIDWLVEVCEEYRLHAETLTLAVSYIDRFLSYMSVVRAKLQLVGTAAMFIAAKYEEIYPPEVGEFVYITDDTYTKKQVLRMEHLILKVLGFDVSVPTALAFINAYCISNKFSESVQYLALYVSELSMLEADPYLQHLPSHLGAAAVAFARYTLDEEPWTDKMELMSQYKMEDLRQCFEQLHKTHSKASTITQQAIQDKYKTSKYHQVSLIESRPLEYTYINETNNTS